MSVTMMFISQGFQAECPPYYSITLE